MTNVLHPSSAEHDRPITAMTWHRRRIRRARQRRESAPRPVARVAQERDAGSPVIRRLVVFVPRAKRAPRAVAELATPPVAPVIAPEPA
jgi:hypothetical protein